MCMPLRIVSYNRIILFLVNGIVSQSVENVAEEGGSTFKNVHNYVEHFMYDLFFIIREFINELV